MAADSRPKCPVCQSPTRDGGWDTFRAVCKTPPIVGENPRRRAQAARIKARNARRGQK